MYNDTIVAQATPVGEGAIGIVRLSGPDSKKILGNIFTGKTSVSDFASRHFYLGQIIEPDGKSTIDQAMVVWMKTPSTFTGEEMAEIHAHGGVFVLCRIVDLVVKNGARLAEPGEFSRRAFLNGKIDLSQAEAIADLIHAKNEHSAKNALMQLGGVLSGIIGRLKEKLVELLSQTEAGFDFSEDDIQLFQKEEGLKLLHGIKDEISALLDSFETGQIYKEGLKVALIGKPNVGKSSLLNALLKEDRAIIHEEPGTTRDVVSGERKINGITVTFHDTAGICFSDNPVEVEGIKRSEKILESADVICLLLDSSSEITPEDHRLIQQTKGKNCIIICSKADLVPCWEPNEEIIGKRTVVHVSSIKNLGIGELLKVLYDIIVLRGLKNDRNYVLNNVRHKCTLNNINIRLQDVISGVDQGSITEECLAEELRMIINDLSQITGEITCEDVLDKIFSRFCVGK